MICAVENGYIDGMIQLPATLDPFGYNRNAFASQADAVVAWGEDT